MKEVRELPMWELGDKRFHIIKTPRTRVLKQNISDMCEKQQGGQNTKQT